MFDLIIRDGLVVSPEATIKADIAVADGKIVRIGNIDAAEEAERVINAEGKYVLPGAIDAHMHVEAPFQGCFGANDFYTQSISAAFGGVTTFMDFTNTFKGKSVMEAVKTRYEEMSKSAIDFGIHGKIVEVNENTMKEIEEIVEFGCPSFKLFMTYKKEGVMSDDETLLKVFEKCREIDALPMVHAENNTIAERNNERFEATNDLKWSNFPKSKPVLCEAEASNRAIFFSRYIGNPLLIVHITNGYVADAVKRAQEEGYPIYAETCPHYMMLFDELYNDENTGYLAICSPPLRTEKEAKELWKGIQEGVISVTGSDDCAYSKKEKTMFLEKDKNNKLIPNYMKVVNGVSGIETRLPILLSEGVNKGRISINKLCEITSANIARLFGCYPQKGAILEGSDADIVIVDMDKKVSLCREVLHNNIDYCLYDGVEVTGYPVVTISRGRVLVEMGEFHGKRGSGRFIKRTMDKGILKKFSL